MKKVLILVEGQTEETFVRDVLATHLLKQETYLIPTVVTTKRVKSGSDFRGGIISYPKLKREIINLLHDASAERVTTMIDFYGLPAGFPGRATLPGGSSYQRVDYLESQFQADIQHHKFIPYLALHEFEALLFTSPHQLAQAFPNQTIEHELSQIKAAFQSPEEIDDSPQTAPSKRIRALLPEYQKPLHGPLVIRQIGIEVIRNECPHFDQWLKKLESLSQSISPG